MAAILREYSENIRAIGFFHSKVSGQFVFEPLRTPKPPPPHLLPLLLAPPLHASSDQINERSTCTSTSVPSSLSRSTCSPCSPSPTSPPKSDSCRLLPLGLCRVADRA